ncbi:MAG: response regulator transcription factor [FCB group bacterium]|nr:response regulator transcription factor [FCB group bacterium]
MRILVVEDDFTSTILMKKLLQPYGDCDFASDGKEALKTFFKAISNDTPYDLITLDVMLPNMDGQTILKKIREMETKFEITPSNRSKIIMTTALSNETDVLRALKAGCDAYLIKPIDSSKLRGQLKNLGFVRKETDSNDKA